MSKDTIKVRVSKKVWNEARSIFPNMSDRVISNLLGDAALPRLKDVFKNKKGSIQDIIFWGVVLVFFGFVMLLGFHLINAFGTQISTMDGIPATAITATTTLSGMFPGIIDNMFLILVVGIVIGAFALASLVRVHPVFIPFYILALLLVIVLSAVGSNIYQEMASNALLLAEANQFLFMGTVLKFLPLFTGVFGTILMIVMYKTWSNSQ